MAELNGQGGANGLKLNNIGNNQFQYCANNLKKNDQIKLIN